MIGISKLYCQAVEPADALRYGRASSRLPSHLLQFSADKKPVVVWNMTRACNLRCRHCYAQAVSRPGAGELSTAQGIELIKDLAAFGAPVMLFSGGEPLMRPDLFHLVEAATKNGMRAVISTNGTLISRDKAKELAELGLSYVGVSLDGMEAVNDRFRGVAGAFELALGGIEHCQEAGLKVGLRFTMNKNNAAEIPAIFDLMGKMGIPRVCFYHLVYSGRGSALMDEDLSHEETRRALDLIMDRTRDFFARSEPREVLTVDNHADGPYVYLRQLAENSEHAANTLELLQMNEGNSSGRGIGCVSWDGTIHADQFWRDHAFGNVTKTPFSEVWSRPTDELLIKLKNKKEHVKGRCASCRWLDVCAGNFRARAEAASGDPWAPDPACYLTDEEIKYP